MSSLRKISSSRIGPITTGIRNVTTRPVEIIEEISPTKSVPPVLLFSIVPITLSTVETPYPIRNTWNSQPNEN